MKRLLSKKGTRRTKKKVIPTPITFISFNSVHLTESFEKNIADKTHNVKLIEGILEFTRQDTISTQFSTFKKLSRMFFSSTASLSY